MPRGKEKVVQYNGPAKAAPIYTERLKAGTWFGFAEVGVEIPKKLRLKFEEMPSFFITKQIPEKPVPQHMKDYAAANDRKKKRATEKSWWEPLQPCTAQSTVVEQGPAGRGVHAAQ